MLFFTWDPKKAAKNLHDHGIDFGAARFALEDPFRVEEIDQIVDGELRLRTMGMAEGQVVVLVVHTNRKMRMELTRLRVSSMQERQVLERGVNMSEFVRVAAGAPMSDEERLQLRALASKPDSEIDFSEIPERIYPAFNSASPLEEHTLTLRLEHDVADWLKSASDSEIRQINFLLKRAAHRSKGIRGWRKRVTAMRHKLSCIFSTNG